MYKTLVAIDIETTGADPYKDRIIELAAVLCENGEKKAVFSELAKSPIPLSPGIIKLTGITPSMLEDARDLESVLADFLEFIPDDAMCIAHNAMFERSFLRVASKDRFKNTVLDTVELARICFPRLPSHSLACLTDYLGFDVDEAHRAEADCDTLLQLWHKIMDRVLEIPPAVVGEINYLLATHTKHPYRDFFKLLEAELLSRNLAEAGRDLESYYPQNNSRIQPKLEDDPETEKQLDRSEMDKIFDTGGAFDCKLDAYEKRDGQLDMAHGVVDAFNGRKHLLVEAGTGIGKSFAYLAPSLLWSKLNEKPVVISTNTKNLQSQLYEKDLPLLRDTLNLDFKSAIIKGRRNYLCLRKLFYVLRQASYELDNEERMRLVNILPWSVWSKSGDISENIVSGRPGFGALWAKLSTIGDECMGRKCRFQRSCFLWKARARAMAADVVVANHSLVFAEMNMKSPALPPYSRIVFDEAHNLEEAATMHLSVEISSPRMSFALGRLYRKGKKGSGSGLIPSIINEVERTGTVDLELSVQAKAHGETIIHAIDGVDAAQNDFFSSLQEILSASRDRKSCVRFYEDRKRDSTWGPVNESKEKLVAAFARVMRGVDALADTLGEMKDGTLEHKHEFVRELEASVQWLKEITFDIEFVLAANDENYVYWVEKVSNKFGRARAWAAPVSVGALLHDQVYSRKDTVVFSSATLSVSGKFDYLKKRLGINLVEKSRLIELDAGTPFDYEKQCQVAIPMFLPEPGERGKDYTAELGVLLSEVFRRTQGRALSLFTSYEMLRNVAQKLEVEMLGDGIRILAQGMSGSRESITSIFKHDVHSVLLGTHSFWEGVDVVGSTLSCLAIARLPFQVFSDPIVEARCERVEAEGANAFMGYSLPSAVIRFRQGFGRLIRHKTDKGIVIVTDRRIISKRYGKAFRDSIPAPVQVYTDREEFLDAIEEICASDFE